MIDRGLRLGPGNRCEHGNIPSVHPPCAECASEAEAKRAAEISMALEYERKRLRAQRIHEAAARIYVSGEGPAAVGAADQARDLVDAVDVMLAEGGEAVSAEKLPPLEEKITRVLGLGDHGPGYAVVKHVWQDSDDPDADVGCVSYCPRCKLAARMREEFGEEKPDAEE